ncbi:hypothetical protein IAU60_005971 [Kwoniella sp. DSM 27419]
MSDSAAPEQGAPSGPSVEPATVEEPAPPATSLSAEQPAVNGDANAEAGPSSPTQLAATSTVEAVPGSTDIAMAEGDNHPDVQITHMQSDAPEAERDGSGPDVTQLFAAKREEELARRDRTLAEFLVMLDGYKPLIPEEVTEYYLQRAGFECSDPRLKRLLSLSAQKFVSDLSRDAFHFAKLRTNGVAAGRGRPAAGVDRNRVVLTMEDLSLALAEHGVNVKKPDYCECSRPPIFHDSIRYHGMLIAGTVLDL